MDPNLVSATLSTEDQQAILSAVNGIASVITSKAANGYHLKTGQRITTVETGVFYSVVFESSKQFSIVSSNRV